MAGGKRSTRAEGAGCVTASAAAMTRSSEQRRDDPPMTTPQRADHRASPPRVLQRQAIRAPSLDAGCVQSARAHQRSSARQTAARAPTIPGRINSRSVFGAPATRGSSRVDGARQEQQREYHASHRVKPRTTPTTNWATHKRHGAISSAVMLAGNRDQRSTLNAPIAAASSTSRGAAASFRLGCSSFATRPVQPVWCDAPTPRPRVTVKVLVEQHVVAEVRVVLQAAVVAEHRAARRRSFAEEDPGQARGAVRSRPRRWCDSGRTRSGTPP